MGGIGSELPLLFEPALDTGKHGIERLRQPAELVIGQVERQAGIQIGGIDGGGQLGNLADRGERPTGHEIAAARGQQEHDRPGNQEGEQNRAQHFLGIAAGGSDLQHPGNLTGCSDRLAHDADRLAAAVPDVIGAFTGKRLAVARLVERNIPKCRGELVDDSAIEVDQPDEMVVVLQLVDAVGSDL